MSQLQEFESSLSSDLSDDNDHDVEWEESARLFFDDGAKAGLIGGWTLDRNRWGRPYHYWQTFTRSFDRKRLVISIIVVILGTVLALIGLVHLVFWLKTAGEDCTTWPVSEEGGRPYTPILHQPDERPQLESIAPSGGWKKPSEIKIVGLIFYGRRRNVDILDCYLLQNLASEGGYLDEVRFIVHTNKEDDKTYLYQLVSQRQDYHVVDAGSCNGWDYSCMWDTSVEKDTIYVKIDDDIAFIHPDAIPQLIHTRIAEPHPYAVSANLVNSPFTGMMHYYSGAIHPLVPDPRKTPSFKAAETWRQSEKPLLGANTTEEARKPQDAIIPPTPYRGHTWLLVSNDQYDLLRTPIGINSQTNGGGKSTSALDTAWRSWAVAAQQHYSLLVNLERDQISKYFFGSPISYPKDKNDEGNPKLVAGSNDTDMQGMPGGEQLFDTQYYRYNLNFIAIWGHDVAAALPMAEDDEEELTVTVPKRVKRPFVIDTRAIVSHFSFYPQYDGMRETDLLDRYRAYANEMVCRPDNRKSPFDKRCEGF